jgi:hypothetical protein
MLVSQAAADIRNSYDQPFMRNSIISFGASRKPNYPPWDLTPPWRRCLGFGLLLSLLVMGRAGAEEAMPPPATLPPAANESQAPANALLPPAKTVRDGPVLLEGKVVEVFGNRFILDAAGERALVEPSGDQPVLSARVGDNVRVEGQRIGALIRAERVFRGTEPVLGPGPGAAPTALSPSATPPVAVPPERTGITAILQDLSITPIGAPVRKKHHTEILARMPDGRTVYVSLDRSDRLWEIEDAEHDKKTAVPRGLTRDDYARLAREAGFTPTGGFEQKRHHVELGVTNRRGERLELHMDLAGTIYKQMWLW